MSSFSFESIQVQQIAYRQHAGISFSLSATPNHAPFMMTNVNFIQLSDNRHYKAVSLKVDEASSLLHCAGHVALIVAVFRSLIALLVDAATR